MIRPKPSPSAARLALLFVLSLAAASAARAQQPTPTPAQTPQPVEAGEFRLHKFEQAIGVESYTVTRDGDSLVVRSTFEFTDRGTKVPLSATLRARQDLTPQSFEIKGKVSRFSTADASVEINGATASVRKEKETRQAQVPARFFTVNGYAPVAMQMMLVRYILAHRVEGPLPVLPGGEVTLEKRGRDEVTIEGKKVSLERYSLSGLIWGRESLWFDAERNLVALVALDAEFDHFEALRTGYESSLPFFVTRAAEDNMAALAALAERLSPARKGALVVTNATLIDGTGRAPIGDAAVVIENGRITAAGPRAGVKIPKGAQVLDAGGGYVMPGLWDMHAHFEQVEWGPAYLAAGVTTVRDVGNEFEFITAVRDAIKTGRGLGPRILLAGVVDGRSPLALGVNLAATPEEGRAVVRRYHDAGFEQIKIYSSLKLDVLKAVCAEAHALGMTVTGHVPQGMDAFEAVEAGMDQINHAQYLTPVMIDDPDRGKVPRRPPTARKLDPDSPAAQAAIRFFKSHGTVFDPTLSIFEWILHPADVPFAQIEPGAAKLPPELVGPINNTGVPAASAPTARATIENFSAAVSALHRAGLPIVAGTDQVVPGHSLHRELELYVEAGFTPLEAIQAATIVPARVMKLDKELGTIEPGKLADLIILDANPLEDIHNTRRVRKVVSGGRVFDAAPLWQSVGFKP
ncbi:MAG TPA: amidohydrolase family protein [Pyrinomonadaceae bacterium]|nr:amidohydrolase family protein [Pyrinomonadaceae bacterium]